MREVMRRRFARLVDEQAAPVVDDDGAARKFAYPPNLVIVDGGPGQLSAALEGVGEVVAERGELGADVAFASLAKRFEELWLPGRSTPVVLPRGSEALYLVQRVRDEAHRFAVSYQRTKRTAAVTTSELDGIPGIGPARRAALLERFGSLAAVRTATVEDLMGVPGLSRTMATQVYEHVHASRDADDADDADDAGGGG
jgi:excinuclease ABC subunit C